MTNETFVPGTDFDERIGQNIFVKWIKYRLWFAPYQRVLGNNLCHTGEWLELYLIRPRKSTVMTFPANETEAVDRGFKTYPGNLFKPLFY